MAPRSQSRRGRSNPRFDADVPLGVLVTAKRVGLSLHELNLLTLEDFTSFLELWVGDQAAGGAKQATQDDIKTLLG